MTILHLNEKVCTRCGETKDLDAFSADGQKRDGLKSICRTCSTDKARLDREAHPRRYREARLKNKFGISMVEYEAMSALQGGLCAICGKSEWVTAHGKLRLLSVDHDHESGQVRGLLCMSCNVGIGKFKDNLELVEKAAAYLRGERS